MSAQATLVAALAEALRGSADLAGWAVFDAPPARAAVPYALVGEPVVTDWSTKDWQGREARCAVTLVDDGERPVRLRAAAGAAEDAVAALADDLGDGWRLASGALLRSRTEPAGTGRWRATIEWRLRAVRGA